MATISSLYAIDYTRKVANTKSAILYPAQVIALPMHLLVKNIFQLYVWQMGEDEGKQYYTQRFCINVSAITALH